MVMTIVSDKFVAFHAVKEIYFRDNLLFHEKVKLAVKGALVRRELGAKERRAQISHG
jgi:hypothetical protein